MLRRGFFVFRVRDFSRGSPLGCRAAGAPPVLFFSRLCFASRAMLRFRRGVAVPARCCGARCFRAPSSRFRAGVLVGLSLPLPCGCRVAAGGCCGVFCRVMRSAVRCCAVCAAGLPGSAWFVLRAVVLMNEATPRRACCCGGGGCFSRVARRVALRCLGAVACAGFACGWGVISRRCGRRSGGP